MEVMRALGIDENTVMMMMMLQNVKLLERLEFGFLICPQLRSVKKQNVEWFVIHIFQVFYSISNGNWICENVITSYRYRNEFFGYRNINYNLSI